MNDGRKEVTFELDIEALASASGEYVQASTGYATPDASTPGLVMGPGVPVDRVGVQVNPQKLYEALQAVVGPTAASACFEHVQQVVRAAIRARLSGQTDGQIILGK